MSRPSGSGMLLPWNTARPIPSGARTFFEASPGDLFTATYVATDAHLVVEYCIDAMGHVTTAHVEIQGNAGTRAAVPRDRDVLARMRTWQFAPYFVDGVPLTACSYLDYSVISS